MPIPPHLKSGEQAILYDGVCKLCNGWVSFLIRHGIKRHVRFVAIQSQKGKDLLNFVGLPDDNIRTIVLIDKTGYLLRSEAIFHAMISMPWPWKMLSLLRFTPRFLSNFIYNRIAFNRYRLFGRYDDIQTIHADHPERFL